MRRVKHEEPWGVEVEEGPLMAIFIGDNGRMPKQPPDPRYLDGKDVDASQGLRGCSITLEHPTPCCGWWALKCERCGHVSIVTAAGRADDPRTITVPCLIASEA
jgi:hypothetical protein